jgi:Flp pilus assembly protein TadG
MIRANAAFLERLWADRRGVTALITAIVSAVLMGVAGLAVDVVVWEFDAHRMQGAADQAALAGAAAAGASYNVADAANAVAASYGFVNGQNGTTISVNSNYNSTNDVQVKIAQVQPQYFSRFFLSTPPTVTKVAVAQPPNPSASGSTCVMALEKTGSLAAGALTVTGGGTVQLGSCDVYNDSAASNGTEINGTSALSVNSMYLAGSYTVGSSASFTSSGVIATGTTPVPDPYAGESIPSYSGCNQTGYTVPASKTVTLSPGVYCGGMTINGKVTLNPGTYIIDGGNLSIGAGANLSGSGVTIILTSSSGSNYGTVTINGSAVVTLSAPTSGSSIGVPGIALWVDKNAPTATDSFNGGGSTVINGVIYMPSQKVDYAGGSSTATECSQLIALTITFTGSSYLTHSGCASSNLPVKDPGYPRLVS